MSFPVRFLRLYFRRACNPYIAELGNAFANSWRVFIPWLISQIFNFGFIQYMNQIISSQIFICQRAEHKINDRSSGFYVRMFNHSGWLKAGEYKFFYKFFQWNTVLQSD